MERELEGREGRLIRVHTPGGVVEGRIATNSGVSTMHYLNVVSTSQNFVKMNAPVNASSDWSFDEGAVAVAASSILFVVELSDFTPKPGDPQEAARFQRSPIRLQVSDYHIEGFVHVPPGGDAIARLNQDRHPFIALTSASVLGPDSEFVASFLAVNRSFIVAVQKISEEAPVREELAAEVGSEI